MKTLVWQGTVPARGHVTNSGLHISNGRTYGKTICACTRSRDAQRFASVEWAVGNAHAHRARVQRVCGREDRGRLRGRGDAELDRREVLPHVEVPANAVT